MSLLTAMQRVADETGLPRAGAYAQSSDQLARQMFALANSTIEELAKKDWPQLVHAYEFDTVVDQEAYPVPEDYLRFATDTAYIASRYYNVRGSLTPAEWAKRRNEIPATLGRFRYRIFGKPCMLHLLPTPSTVEKIVIEYSSKGIVEDANGVRKVLFTEDTDVTVIPEELIRRGVKWRIKHAKGLDYSEDFNAYEVAVSTLYAQALNLGSIPVAVRYFNDTPELTNGYIPDTGFGV